MESRALLQLVYEEGERKYDDSEVRDREAYCKCYHHLCVYEDVILITFNNQRSTDLCSTNGQYCLESHSRDDICRTEMLKTGIQSVSGLILAFENTQAPPQTCSDDAPS